MDFLQFINHIQKKITGKNRVHGIGQGHNPTHADPDSNGTAPIGYFNADMVDGAHVRNISLIEVTNNKLTSAKPYIPLADGSANPNLVASSLSEKYGNTTHSISINSVGSLEKFTGTNLDFKISSNQQATDSLDVGDLATNIEPVNHKGVFYGSSLGIRAWGEGQSGPFTTSNRGWLYLGAVQSGGIGVWTISKVTNDTNNPNPNGYAGRIINPDGTINGDAIKYGDSASGLSVSSANYINAINGNSPKLPLTFNWEKSEYQSNWALRIYIDENNPNAPVNRSIYSKKSDYSDRSGSLTSNGTTIPGHNNASTQGSRDIKTLIIQFSGISNDEKIELPSLGSDGYYLGATLSIEGNESMGDIAFLTENFNSKWCLSMDTTNDCSGKAIVFYY